MIKAIKCGRLFDSTEACVKENMTILVEGEKIISVEDTDSLDYEGYELIDLSDKFVMPGLVECHVHVSETGASDTFKINATQTIGDATLIALKNVQAQLLSGFTTLRNAGSPGFLDVSLRNAINKGLVHGPRIVASGSCIGSTGGHADSQFNPYIKPVPEMIDGQVVDGPYEAMRAARFVIKYGADVVKFMSTGGVTTMGTTLGAQQLTYEEMRGLIEVAEMYGVATLTHAHGAEGIKTAVRAGVTSIEHGTLADDECVELMVERGTYLTPTISASRRILERGQEAGVPPYAMEKAREAASYHEASFRKCLDAGVKIVFGTDAGSPCNPHGDQHMEFQYLCEFGMTPLQTLVAATRTGAELLRMWDRIGSIEEGKYADIIAVDGNPLEHVMDIANMAFVMKGGTIYKEAGTPILPSI